MPITAVEPASAAARAGITAGERLRTLNGVALRDVIDLRFEGAEAEIEAVLEDAAGARRTVHIERLPGEALGIETEEMKARTCANKCVFCFIDQMPHGRRRGLYVRDEDYRFSFLHGNYVTLTNVREREIERMIEQGLSPIYVSVHATDPAVRARLLGIEDRGVADVVPRLERLIAGGVQIHAQIVLCPGWNDGAVLDATIERLAGLYPGVDSVAVVPLGQTRHRQGLVELQPVTVTTAQAVVAQCQAWQRRLAGARRPGTTFVYLADEWYFLAGAPLPPAAHYRDFPQLEDGVGLTRRFIDRLRAAGERLPIIERLRGRRVTVVTATMAAPVVAEHLVDGLLARHARAVELVVVENTFLGPGITVAGLLAGGDIRRAVQQRWQRSQQQQVQQQQVQQQQPPRSGSELLLLPPACVNGRGLFLDDLPLATLERQLGVPVVLGLGDATATMQTNPVWEKE